MMSESPLMENFNTPMKLASASFTILPSSAPQLTFPSSRRDNLLRGVFQLEVLEFGTIDDSLP
jgi:hypothetical protein